MRLPAVLWAACTSAGRRGAWKDLPAATFVSVAIAVPLMVLSAGIETHVAARMVALGRYTF